MEEQRDDSIVVALNGARPLSQNVCKNCAHHAPTKGQCRRLSPIPMLIGMAQASVITPGQASANAMIMGTWPPVDPDDWCSEWRQSLEKGAQ